MAGATPRVAIVGAGLAGLTAARRLADAGFAPVIFEKSRGLGGRLATRRASDRLSFDHGAQFITAKSPEFEAFLKAASEIGDAALWRPRLAAELKPAPDPWRVGAPGMSGLVSNLAAGLDIRLQTRIAGLTSVAGGWRIECEDTSAAAPTFDSVILTAPAKQTADLAETAGAPFSKAERAVLAPCWALMAAFNSPAPADFDVWRSRTAPIAWLARDSSKPGRSSQQDAWVAHANPEWSAAHLELEPEDIEARLIGAVLDLTGAAAGTIASVSAHRWRFAMASEPVGEPFLADPSQTLFAAGDWLLGARVECAFESGGAAAEAVLAGA